MRIMHLSDLHLGKSLNGYNLEEDQRYILGEILRIAKEEQVDVVVVAGDVYDKSLPSVSAVNLLDDFLVGIGELHIPVILTAGNHDSQDRLAYGGRLLAQTGVYISATYQGRVEQITLEDKWGVVNFYLLPFIKPSMVRSILQQQMEGTGESMQIIQEVNSTDKAVAWALQSCKEHLKLEERNVLIAHQFVTGGKVSDSEEIMVGGIENVSKEHFQDFDYVALGHLHTPQNVGEEYLRYCGTPLKYSVSEAKQEKSVTIIDLLAKGERQIKTIPLKPWRDLRIVQGCYEEITWRENYLGSNLNDFVAVILDDEEEIPEASNRLRVIYPNILQLTYSKSRDIKPGAVALSEVPEESPLDLFKDFFAKQNKREMSLEQVKLVQEILEEMEHL